MGTTAKGLAAGQAYSKRWYSGRKNRILDDRDFLLAEALKNVEAHSDAVYPALTSLSTGLGRFFNVRTADAVLTGTDFVGDTRKASGVSDSGVTAKQINWTRVIPGDADISVVLVSSGVADHAVDGVWDAGTSTLTLTCGTLCTATELVAEVADDAPAKFIVDAVVPEGGGAGIPTPATVALTGGIGSLPALQVGAIAVDGSDAFSGFTAFTDTSITFSVDGSGLPINTLQVLRLWVDDVLVAAVPLFVLED